MSGPRLTAARRELDLEVLAEQRVDVLVVGGGVSGCGVALDAASRGLSVALVEKDDLAHGTSRWSSKLVHGGLRYLATGDVGLAMESARERGVLLTRTAPHLVRPLPLLAPLTPDLGRVDGLLFGAGQWAGNVLRRSAGTRYGALPRPRRLGVAETTRLLPAVRREGLRGGVLGWDGQLEDDARLVVALARTAASYGARVVTRARALRLDGDGAEIVDACSGQRLRIRAGAVVNATGVWADTLSASTRLRPSKGAHVVLPAAALGHPAAAMTVPVPGQKNRFVFALPHPDGIVHVGLTDDPLDGPVPEVPTVEAAEEEFLLVTLSRALERPLQRSDVVGRFAGVRPLLAGVEGRTADLSRRHTVLRDGDGVVTLLGGKLTTYRRMAQDAVDALAPGRPCRTRELPLVGAVGPAPGHVPARLVRRYGSEAGEVAALAEHDPRLLEPVAPGVPVLGVELRWGVLAEGALTADDLLERRTRLSLVDAWGEAARPAAEAALGGATVG